MCSFLGAHSKARALSLQAILLLLQPSCSAPFSKPGFSTVQLPKENGRKEAGTEVGVAREPEGGETTDIRSIQKWKEGELGRRRRV